MEARDGQGVDAAEETSASPASSPAPGTVSASHPATTLRSPQDSLEMRRLLNSACQLEANLHWIIIFN